MGSPMKNLPLTLVLAVALPLAATTGCQNSETNYQDQLPETTEFAPTDTSVKVNNKLDSAERAIARDRDTSRSADGQ